MGRNFCPTLQCLVCQLRMFTVRLFERESRKLLLSYTLRDRREIWRAFFHDRFHKSETRTRISIGHARDRRKNYYLWSILETFHIWIFLWTSRQLQVFDNASLIVARVVHETALCRVPFISAGSAFRSTKCDDARFSVVTESTQKLIQDRAELEKDCGRNWPFFRKTLFYIFFKESKVHDYLFWR